MFKKILSKVLSVLLILLAVLCVTIMAKKAMGKEPTIFGCRIFYIVTGSMEPTIPVGSAVLVHKDANNDYEVGDVITFKASQQAINGQPNTHRIVAKEMADGQPVYTTKGDANSSIDAEPVYAKNVYGKVIWSSGSMKWLGTFMGMVTTPVGFFSCIILPILAIAGIMAKDFAKSYKQAMEEDAKAQYEQQLAQQQSQQVAEVQPAQQQSQQVAEAQPAQQQSQQVAEAQPAQQQPQQMAEAQPQETGIQEQETGNAPTDTQNGEREEK